MATKDIDVEEPELDEGDEGEEPEETTEPEEPQPVSPAVVAKPKVEDGLTAAAQAFNKMKEQKKRRRIKGEKNVGFMEKDAHFLWGEILEQLQDPDMQRDPAAVLCFVERTAPPPGMPLGSFTCDAFRGGPDAVIPFIGQYFHSRHRGPATYTLQFVWKDNSRKIAMGTLRLPSPEEMANIGVPRQDTFQGAMNAPPYDPYQQAPPRAPWQPPPQPPAQKPPTPAPGFGAMPPSQGGDQVAELRVQVGTLLGRIDQILETRVQAAMGQQQSPVTPPAAAPAAQANVLDADTVAEAVLRRLGVAVPPSGVVDENTIVSALLRRLGIALPQPPAAAPTPQQGVTVAQSATGNFRELLKQMKEFESLKHEIRNLFAPEDGPPVDEPPPDPPLEATAMPVDDKRWTSVELPGPKWSNGDAVRWPKKKGTDSTDWEGVFFENPGLSEKLVDAASKIVDRVVHAAKEAGINVDSVTQVVGETPEAARDANDHAAPNHVNGSRPWPKSV